MGIWYGGYLVVGVMRCDVVWCVCGVLDFDMVCVECIVVLGL